MQQPEEEQVEALTPTAELARQARIFAMEGANLWEEELRLVIKEKPRWCPHFLYAAAIRLVIRQERLPRKYFHENFTRRRRWKLFRPNGGLPPSLNMLFPPPGSR